MTGRTRPNSSSNSKLSDSHMSVTIVGLMNLSAQRCFPGVKDVPFYSVDSQRSPM